MIGVLGAAALSCCSASSGRCRGQVEQHAAGAVVGQLLRGVATFCACVISSPSGQTARSISVIIIAERGSDSTSRTLAGLPARLILCHLQTSVSPTTRSRERL